MNIYKDVSYKRIYFLDGFWDEYRSLFKKSKNDFEFYVNHLNSNLYFLDNVATMNLAIQTPNFEKLSNYSLYSIRHISKLNPRVIFYYHIDDIDNPGQIILLTAFLEKRKSDYEKAIKKANSIVKNF